MTDDPDWRRVAEAFEAVVDLPAGERAPELARRCAGDEDLARRVGELLAEHDVDTDGLPTAAPSANDPLLSGLVGAVLGGFRLGRVLGRGGTGVVFEAEQERPRRRVALKVLRPELLSAGARRRFEVEAEVLARLSHPGIAQVIASGVHRIDARGFSLQLPWTAMELLEDARPLTEWADTRAMSTPARCDLLRLVCDAVSYAHGRGVIHRDLKPHNVLVDAAGRPRVIDFGIARSRDPHAAWSGETRATDLLGSLHWMAPEQVDGRADQVDVRVDVYALGVMLFELVTGALPLPTADRPLAEALDAIRHAAPAAPSRVARRTPRAIDWIVARCLEKDPERRYPTVAALGADLARLGTGEALEAGPPTVAYRAASWVRRHRLLSVASVTVATLLGGWIASLDAALRRTREAESTARGALEEARSQLERADAVNGLMQFAIGRAAGGRTAEEIRLGDVLAEMEAAIGVHEFRPEVDAAVCTSLAEHQLELGRYDRAAKLLDRGVARLGAAGLDTSPAMRDARLLRARLDALRGRLAEGATQLETADSIAQESDPPGLDDASAHERVRQLLAAGRFAAAEAALRPVIARLSEAGADPGANLSVFQNSLAMTLGALGRFAEAEQVARSAGEGERRDHADQPARAANAELTLATILVDAGRVEEGRDLAEDARARLEAELGSEHHRVLAARTTLARAAAATGQRETALRELEDVLARSVPQRDADHPDVLRTRVFRAELLVELGRITDARATLQEILAVDPAQFREGHPTRALAAALLGRCAVLLGDGAGGREVLREAERALREELPADHPTVARVRSWIERPK